MLKLFAIYVLIITSPIILYALKLIIIKNLKEQKEKQQNTQKLLEERQKTHYTQAELPPIYYQTQKLFHDLIQQGKLNHYEVAYIKKMLQNFLGSYNDYGNFKFQNDAHYIYTALKNRHLYESDYQEILNYLLECQRRNTNEKDIQSSIVKQNQ